MSIKSHSEFDKLRTAGRSLSAHDEHTVVIARGEPVPLTGAA